MSKPLLFLSLLLAATGCIAEVEDADEPLVETSEALSGCQPGIPPELAVPAGNRLAFTLYAEGTQNYYCNASGVWTFDGPIADLYNAHGRPKGTHYKGPTWEANDGSTVKAAVLTRATPDTTAIPWLLLQATEHGGHGRMSRVSYIQRIDTTDGLSPTGPCRPSPTLVEVPYTATYNFFEPLPAHSH